MFQLVFNHLLPLAAKMQYWKGEKETKREARTRETSEYEEYLFAAGLSRKRPGPSRKLTLEQEFLLVMMRLRCGSISRRFGFSVQSCEFSCDICILYLGSPDGRRV